MKAGIVRRYGQNPILTKTQIPYPVETVHNAAVVKHRDQYIMLFPVSSPHRAFHHWSGPEPGRIPLHCRS
jgi:predicted GH43/DUF377 family glycosyl hydrolase